MIMSNRTNNTFDERLEGRGEENEQRRRWIYKYERER